MYYALFYTTTDDYLERRTPHRSAHFDYLQPYLDRGILLMGGAFEHAQDGALLIFKTEDQSEIERFATRDPYVLNGVVTKWEIKKWNVAISILT